MKKLFRSQTFWIITITLGISLILGSLFGHLLPKLPVVSDSVDYHTIAKGILEGNGYVAITDGALIYPPLYPLFLVLIYSFSHIGAYAAVYQIQYILVAILGLVVFFTLKKYFEVRTWIAALAGTGILFWPYLVMYTQLISSEILYIPFLVGFFAMLLCTTTSPTKKNIILTGILLGLTILTRPVALLLAPWIIIGGFILEKISKGSLPELPYKKYAMIFLVALATLIPWEGYVLAKHHRLIPIASNLPGVFAKANKNFGYLSTDSTPQEFSVAKLVSAKIKNVYLFWNPGGDGYHIDLVSEKYSGVRVAITLYRIVFFALLFLAFLGVLWYFKRINVLLTALVVGYFWALHTALFPFPRYMLPMIPFVIILAAVAIEGLVSRYASQSENSRISPR